MAVAKKFTANTTSVPAPIGGWNARDSQANMNPMDAISLVNWYPTPTDVSMRKGWSQVSLLTTELNVKTISSITHVNTVATLTTATAHGLLTGSQVAISGCVPVEYNGVYKITVTGATTFTYTMGAIPATNATTIGIYRIGITTPINSLMNYTENAGYKLFAAAGTNMYETEANPAVVVFSNITSDKFQHTNITNQAGHFLVACNGSDPTMIYDGTRWFYIATTTTAATITNIARTSPSATALVTTSTAHGLVTGNRVTITGASDATLNGTFVITVTSPTTYTYTSTGTSTVTSVSPTLLTVGPKNLSS
jgi:hypothetical protein